MCHNRHMRYETVEHLKDTDFKRLTGVQRETFDWMLKVVEKGLRDFGRPTKLSRADQLLMILMYWREYRTEFAEGVTVGAKHEDRISIDRVAYMATTHILQRKLFLLFAHLTI